MGCFVFFCGRGLGRDWDCFGRDVEPSGPDLGLLISESGLLKGVGFLDWAPVIGEVLIGVGSKEVGFSDWAPVIGEGCEVLIGVGSMGVGVDTRDIESMGVECRGRAPLWLVDVPKSAD